MDNNGFNFFENSGYNNQRNKVKTLILDVRDGNDLTIDGSAAPQERSNLNDASEFQIKLFEPLIIDKQSEIYLDHLITYNCNLSHTSATAAFCLKINEFNIQTNVASYDDSEQNTIYNSIVIPNENNVPENYFGAVSHKGKKFNYVCDINPTTIHSLSGKITNLDGSAAFHGGSQIPGAVYTFALTGITGWGGAAGGIPLFKTEQIINITINNSIAAGPNLLTAAGNNVDATVGDSAIILVDAIPESKSIIFSARKSDIFNNLNASDTIHMKIGPSGLLYEFSGNLQVLKENGRFIAEFSIVAKN